MRCSKCGAEYSDNFCPHCDAPIDTNAPTKRTHNLFGFRSNKWWKKVLSAFYLSFCAIMLIGALLSDKTGKITTYDYIIDKIHSLILLSILFSPYIFLSNTKFRSKLPLLKKHTFISSSISMMFIVILLFTIFGFVNTLHSAEYLEDMENHAYVQTAETAATCETDGQIERLCEYCGCKKTEIIPTTGHKMNETARESATETNDGKSLKLVNSAENKRSQL